MAADETKPLGRQGSPNDQANVRLRPIADIQRASAFDPFQPLRISLSTGAQQNNLQQIVVGSIYETNAIKLRRREWLILCGVALGALAIWDGNRAFSGKSAMQRRRAGAEEWLQKVDEARRAERRRGIDRSNLFKQPEIETAWVRQAHDRFTASPTHCDLIVKQIGNVRTRSIMPVSVEDQSTGDLLRLEDGSYGDRNMYGTLRVGREGKPVSFYIEVRDLGSGSLFTVDPPGLYYRPTGVTRPRTERPTLNDAAMKVFARVFNCLNRGFFIVGPTPVVMDRRKPRYAGSAGYQPYLRDRESFLDRYVDKYYASHGLDPAMGRLDPDSIPRPW